MDGSRIICLEAWSCSTYRGHLVTQCLPYVGYNGRTSWDEHTPVRVFVQRAMWNACDCVSNYEADDDKKLAERNWSMDTAVRIKTFLEFLITDAAYRKTSFIIQSTTGIFFRSSNVGSLSLCMALSISSCARFTTSGCLAII